MLTVLAFYFGNRFGQVFDFNTMEITDGALATVNSIVAAPAAISSASVPMLYAIGLAITVLIVWLYTFMYIYPIGKRWFSMTSLLNSREDLTVTVSPGSGIVSDTNAIVSRYSKTALSPGAV